MTEITLLIRNVRELVNPAHDTVVRGGRLNSLRLSRDVWIGAQGEHIRFVGFETDFKENCRLAPDAVEIDGSDMVAFPGFVDPHTHLPFGGTRQEEFRLKLQGVDYREIARQGGGIKRTVADTRAMTREQLAASVEKRLDRMLLSGTTTCEAKSGYGLDRDTEIKQLEVIDAVNEFHPVELVPTFMGAHEIPEEFVGRNRDFIDFQVREVMPGVRERNLAEFADIFCEEGVFSVDEAAEYLDRAREVGFKLKIHADEFTSNGAAKLAVDKGARSAEHLIAMTPDEISAISASDTACIFLPGVSFFLRMSKYAPARSVISENGIVALGSDFNPGSSMISSQLFIFHLGVFHLGLTIEEALNAVTINAAYAIDRQDSVGSLVPGKKMDVLLADIPDYSYLAYHPGLMPWHTIVKSGEVVVQDYQPLFNR
ncbi:MAG TPA: imidazolonepropionase [Candidatus Aminicenantes bacterium]|nr:imidazolonepropionase [Candidatus Aminicenantes bacterium]